MLMVLLFLVLASVAKATTPSCPSKPTNFPSNITLNVTNFVNWDTEMEIDNLWTATPSTPDDVVQLANWAKDNGYKLRASGIMHSWSPITVTTDTPECGNTILVKTNAYLNKMEMVPNANQVIVQTGATLDNLTVFLESKGFGFYNYPGIGDITVGGMLAIDGYSFGTVSSLIASLTAVVWDNVTNGYILKTFQRSDPEAGAFLVSLGRSFLTEVTLNVIPDYNMRCVSKTNIPMDELCADSTTGRTASSFLNQTGRLEIILFPFTNTPWTKIWSICPTKPLLSRKVTQPYNYPFSDNYPTSVLDLVTKLVNGSTWYVTPLLGQAFYATTVAGLQASLSGDIWGKSKNTILYYKPNIPHGHEASHVILTRRSNIQKVLNSFYNFYKSLLNQFEQQGKFPVNGPLQIRFNSVGASNGKDLGLSALYSMNDNRNFDVGIWINFVNTVVPNNLNHGEFMRQIESFLYGTINGPNAIVRPEWSKGYAFTSDGPFKNATILNNFIPNSFPSNWQSTVSTWNKYDPKHIFTNSFLDSLFVM